MGYRHNFARAYNLFHCQHNRVDNGRILVPMMNLDKSHLNVFIEIQKANK